ncbi:MAG: trypsin-like peptidase domain-containing protein, partial [Candidatus Eisenbacteria bacterium]|nr:trypsin-like peptidase domain-containing protein [Candidatus Eisenbacteria bacterium]
LPLVFLFLAGTIGGGLVAGVVTRDANRAGGRSAAVQPVSEAGRAEGQRQVAGGTGQAGEDGAGAGSRGDAGEGGISEGLHEGRRNAIVQAAEKVGPSVVSISVEQTRYVRGRSPVDPFGLFFDRYLPGPIYQERVPALGSGFLVDRAGVILTNEHVVRNAETIRVTLTDGRTFPAKLIGSDPSYDLAVLRIEGEDLPVAPLGDSDDVIVGEWAIAIGNPFGFLLNDYQPSVTAGVISAKGRDIKPSEGTTGIYKNMIQTDAAINPGNSGGPLVNGEGKVVGINTFIFTESGGSLGIGFAIPINVAVRVVKDILQYGEVRRIWTGISVKPITPALAAYFNIEDPRGLIVWEIETNSPADRAGVTVGDIIRKVNGEPVWTLEQASRLIFGAQAGEILTLSVERQGARKEIRMRLELAPQRGQGSQGRQG